jgi:hypothetical protein
MRPPRRWLVAALVCLIVSAVRAPAAGAWQAPAAAPVKVFLDCSDCFADFLRTDVAFVDYVRDRTEAEVHALISRAQTGPGGSEYTIAFTGLGRFSDVNETVRTVTTISDTDDVVRRQLATALRIGLLRYVAREAVPANLGVTVRIGSEERRPGSTKDPWKNWVFSLRGSASFEGEESSRQRQLSASLSADRITADWKISIGGDFEFEREEFDLDEDDPVKVERRERDLNWVVVKAINDHWSYGATGEIESSTFDNTKLSVSAYPAVEFNVFPYSMYTRRQLRALYGIGVVHARYDELTLFGRLEETRPRHVTSLTLDQRERWGTLQARLEWSQYLHDLGKSRLEAEGDLSVRLARGLSVEAEINASRIRDQLSLPVRGATPEEILLRLRQLQSGYEYSVTFGVTYTFGSIFSSIVNPRFGQ